MIFRQLRHPLRPPIAANRARQGQRHAEDGQRGHREAGAVSAKPKMIGRAIWISAVSRCCSGAIEI
jgi:hypothetical protein